MNRFVFYLTPFIWMVAVVQCYEKVNIYSDNDSIISTENDTMADTISVLSNTKYGLEFRSSTTINVTLPDELNRFEFILTHPKENKGRYILETPFTGLHIRLDYKRRQKVDGLCDLFREYLPCVNVKQCSMDNANSITSIDLDEILWTPVSLVPYSTMKPIHIVGEEWNHIGNIIIPADRIRYENYQRGGCISSVYNRKLFHLDHLKWYPYTESATMRYSVLRVNNYRYKEIELHEAYHILSPLVITDASTLDATDSTTDVTITTYGDDREFHRATPTGHKILYPIREFLLWEGNMKMTLSPSNQLTMEGTLSARDAVYNPYYDVYDSRTATALYLPKGVYVDLAEMELMYASGKIPAFATYSAFVDTDLSYEEAKPQMIVFYSDAAVYPLPPQLDVNITIPIHVYPAATATSQIILPPAFFICSPVKDLIMSNDNPIWWQPAYPKSAAVEIAIPERKENRKEQIVVIAMLTACSLCVLYELIRELRKSFVC